MQVKDDSLSIVPSSTRKLSWPSTKVRGVECPVVHEAKCLGYYVTCSGDVSKNRQRLLGALRGGLRTGRRHMKGLPCAMRAHWWKIQYRGLIGYFAAFLGLSRSMMRLFEVIDNAGARFVANLRPNNNSHQLLMSVKSEHAIDVPKYVVQSVVRRIGHVFRHDTVLRTLWSLPCSRRLASLRQSNGGGVASEMRRSIFDSLRWLGVQVDEPIGGRLGVRGHGGHVYRWGDPWFEAVRDVGEGWVFDSNDTAGIDRRTSVLLSFLERGRSNDLALENGPLPIENG